MKNILKNKTKRKYLMILTVILIIILLRTFFPTETTFSPDNGQGNSSAEADNNILTPSDNSGNTPDTDPAADSTSSDNTNQGNHTAADEFEVHILDVGQGLAVLVLHDDMALLYDGGERYATTYVVSYLNRLGIQKLDFLIASHYDSDHLYGVVAAMNAFEIDTFIGADYVTESPAFDAFEQACRDWDIQVTHPKVGDTFTFGAGSFQVLGPMPAKHEDENNYSLVIKLTLGESSMLLTGDASVQIENEIMKNNGDVDSDVLVLGHHGSSDATGDKFLKKVSPQYAIISCGLFNDHGHPHWEIAEALEEKQIPTYRTDLQDTIIFTMSENAIAFEKQPCTDYSSGNDLIAKREDLPPDVDMSATSDTEEAYVGVDEFNYVKFNPEGFTYILNTGGKKFHRIDCDGIYDMSARNRQGTLKSREELIDAGYKGCGTCNP